MTNSDQAPRNNEPAYVLHTYPYRETSVIVEVFSLHAGRVALIAKGAKRPRSAMRGQLLSFQPLELCWFGKSEPRTLRSVEWRGGLSMLRGLALLCGFYMNELLLKLLPREDPHEALFDAYTQALHSMSEGTDLPPILRRFELVLLRELGYGLLLDRESGTDAPVHIEKYYAYISDHGPVARHNGASQVQFHGKTLLDLQREDFSDPITLTESKQLLRNEIKHRLGNQELHTRQLLKDLQEL
jgi:DNA repair protein RecO (recombination protein O)